MPRKKLIRNVSYCDKISGSLQIFSHGLFLLLSVFIHLFLNIMLVKTLGPVGFIFANCLNSVSRMFYNWWHILQLFKRSQYSSFSFRMVLPSMNLLLFDGLALVVMLISYHVSHLPLPLTLTTSTSVVISFCFGNFQGYRIMPN